jgi:hypothetical protein
MNVNEIFVVASGLPSNRDRQESDMTSTRPDSRSLGVANGTPKLAGLVDLSCRKKDATGGK